MLQVYNSINILVHYLLCIPLTHDPFFLFGLGLGFGLGILTYQIRISIEFSVWVSQM